MDPPLGDEVGDAVGDDAGLAGAGPGEDQQRAVRVLDGLTLSRVKGGEDGAAGGGGHATRMIQVFGCAGQCGEMLLAPALRGAGASPV